MTMRRHTFLLALTLLACAHVALADPSTSPAEKGAQSTFNLQQQAAEAEVARGVLDAVWRFHKHKREVCRQSGWLTCQAQATADLADEASSNGKLAVAIELASEATALAARAHAAGVGRWALFVLADALMTHGDLPRSHRFAQQLERESAETADDQHRQCAHMLLGDVARRRGEGVLAQQHFRSAYAFGERLGRPDLKAVARLYEGLALIDDAHDARTAVAVLGEAANLYAAAHDSSGELRALLGQGKAHVEMGSLDLAQQALSRAGQLAAAQHREPFVGRIDAELAWLDIRLGRAIQAESRARNALRISETLEFSEDRWAAHHVLGKSLNGRDDAAAAREYDQAIALVAELLTRSGGRHDCDGTLRFGRIGNLFREAIELNLRLGRGARALEILETGRDADLRRQFDAAKINAQSSALQRALDGVTTARAEAVAAKRVLIEEQQKADAERNTGRLAALTRVAASTDGELRQLLAALRRDHRAVSDVLSVGRGSLAELREALPEGTLVVEYFLAGDDAYALLLSRDKSEPRAVKLPVSATAVDAAVVQWRNAHGASAIGRGGHARGATPVLAVPAATDPGRCLYDWLLAPLQPYMNRAKTTLVVPFGSLYLLPLHALQAPDGRFALEKFRIAYLSRATSLRAQSASRSHRPLTLLALGNPDRSLPGAAAEVERVRRAAFPQARVLLEAEATKRHFLELVGQFRIVHFATHGILSSDPTSSYLQLADERLKVNEILGLEDLQGKVDLVVLSACDTAIEREPSTGDPISIAEAFSAAGASALVASLWGVDDEATAELMVQLYTHLASGRGDLLDAIRNAQLHILRQSRWQDPEFWAAFKLMGSFQ